MKKIKWKVMTDVKELQEALTFWNNTADELKAESEYYQAELVKAHTLIGRITHQVSERWDSVNLTKYFPTDNLHRKRTVGNAKGEKPDQNT